MKRSPISLARLLPALLLLLSCLLAAPTALGQGDVSSPYATRLKPASFADLGAPANGSIRYCSDCQATSPCTSGGTGATATRVNGAWACSTGSSGGAPSGAAGGVLGGAYPNPSFAVDQATQAELDARLAALSGNQAQIPALVSGGGVIWESAYVFRVSAATYLIQGVLYSSAEQTITLDAAHATLDRIDVLALNTSGTLVKISGTAAAQPSEPDYDPSTQLKLTFVFVAAASTQPAGVSNESIYLENAEWTSSTSGSGWNANSTSNPRTGTKTIEGTTVANNAYVQLQRSSPTALDSFATLSMFVRSKATWNNNRVLRIQFFSAGVAKGTAVTLASGYWGFDSSVTSGYQLVSIPVSNFVVPAGTQVNQLRVADSGGSIGLYVDDIVLQTTSTAVGNPPRRLASRRPRGTRATRSGPITSPTSLRPRRRAPTSGSRRPPTSKPPSSAPTPGPATPTPARSPRPSAPTSPARTTASRPTPQTRARPP